jgi:Fur family ferric uptake transcriptional regulator
MKDGGKNSPTLIDTFLSKGIRLTPQRRAILEVIESAEGHLDASTLIRQAQERDANISRATVYRTIEILKRLRLIDELNLMYVNGEKRYYEVRTGNDHIHLACFVCGKIEEFTSPLIASLTEEISRTQGFQIAMVRMEVGGRCTICGPDEESGMKKSKP